MPAKICSSSDSFSSPYSAICSFFFIALQIMITSSAISFNLQATAGGAGSPVDVAKSYMRARLPWGSPTVNSSEFRSPSSAGMQFLKEGTPFSYSAGNFSSSKVRTLSFPIYMQSSAYFSYCQMLFESLKLFHLAL